MLISHMSVVMKGVLIQFLLRYDYEYIKGRTYDLNYKERHVQKDSSLTECTRSEEYPFTHREGRFTIFLMRLGTIMHVA